MIFESIVNRSEFFSNHYLDAVIAGDLGDLRGAWDAAEGRGESTPRSRIRAMSTDFFAARATASEATTPERRATAMHAFNDVVLAALGFAPSRTSVEFTKGEADTVDVPLAHLQDTPSGRLLVALEVGMAVDVDDLFDSTASSDGLLLEPLARRSDKAAIGTVPDAVSELFATDDPPRYVLIVAGTFVLLAERGKWAEGRFLAVDLDGALERHDTKKAGELETIAALFSADALVPGALIAAEGTSPFEQFVDRSHKHAVGVSKELRNSIRRSIEILANEVIAQRLNANLGVYTGENRLDATDLTRQCLRWLYRLLVLLYAESRPELGVVPPNDDAYTAGYSLDRLRELLFVDLDTGQARSGSHLHQSLQRLFDLVNDGYHADHAQQAFTLDAFEFESPSSEEYLQFPGLDAGLFDANATPLLDSVTLRNEALQRVLALLMLSPEGKGNRADRGFISYAQLGINQLGAVYEGLMAYTGFFADQDLFEVARQGDPKEGTWVLPVGEANEYPDEVFVKQVDLITGREERVRHAPGSFVLRLSGRDRQRSASYYTPEVLTRCLVKHALAELLGLDDYAPEHGSTGISEARQILDLTICEPALGSGAFLNEAINQLSTEYLRRRQEELGEALDPEEYRRELQKVKAHFALHQCYGVDLNATAVELAEVSLWLNCMHPGLKAPWFGLQLRRGNSLIGCRRATWRVNQLTDHPWSKTKKGEVMPPVDRPLGEPLDDDEIHQFLLPSHGWAAAADRKEAKELRPEEVKALKDWRTKILKAPSKGDTQRLQALAAAVEELWARASERIRLAQRALRRPLGLYGATTAEGPPTITRAEAERVINDPDSALGRLRALMDLWVGLWFWPIGAGVKPPTWNEWLTLAEELVDVDDRHGPSGQLGFDDLAAFLERERGEPFATSVSELTAKYPWLAVARDAARQEGAWHWQLEFAPVFQQQGGFDLQVGNPPWVRPVWDEDLVLAELDPWFAVLGDEPATRDPRSQSLLATTAGADFYVQDLSRADGLVAMLSSPQLYGASVGIQTNLYLAFVQAVGRHLAPQGVGALLHPLGHFRDPSGGAMRRWSYPRLRRLWQFKNEGYTFEDIHNKTEYGMAVYAVEATDAKFLLCANLIDPATIDESLRHDGSGDVPERKRPDGRFDTRPHRERILTVDNAVLLAWARVYAEDVNTPLIARLLLPHLRSELQVLDRLASPAVRIRDLGFEYSGGLHEANSRKARIVVKRTARPNNLAAAIIQGPHISLHNPIYKEPNVDCRSNRDYALVDLTAVPTGFVPRTNYQWSVSEDLANAEAGTWSDGSFKSDTFRLAWRAMADAGNERSLYVSLIPPGPSHINSVFSLRLASLADTVATVGVCGSLVVDYLTRVSSAANIKEWLVAVLPALDEGSRLRAPIIHRTLRLNGLTEVYATAWGQLFNGSWASDRSAFTEPLYADVLGGAVPAWTLDLPVRADAQRRILQVELDALVALALNCNIDGLTAIYRAQFAVLRQYESRMVFDAEGHRICRDFGAYGVRQTELQEHARKGALPAEWSNIWQLYEQYESDPPSVDWLGHYTPPFCRPDREKEMTRAYEEFQRRLEAGEYD